MTVCAIPYAGRAAESSELGDGECSAAQSGNSQILHRHVRGKTETASAAVGWIAVLVVCSCLDVEGVKGIGEEYILRADVFDGFELIVVLADGSDGYA